MEADTSPIATLSRRRSSPPFLNPIVLIVLIPTLTLIIIFLILPLFIYFTSNVTTIKPVFIKKGWDSLNILLVLVAVLCGIFAKTNDEVLVKEEVIKSQPSDSDPWYECYEKEPVRRGGGMRRNSSSYPHLREVSEWDNSYSQFRFFDDFELTKAQYNRHRLRGSEAAEIDSSDTKVIAMETSDFVQAPPPVTLAAEPPPPYEEVAEPRLIHSLPKPNRRKERQIEVEKEQEENTYLATSQVEKKRRRQRKVRNSHEKEEKSMPPPQLFPPLTPAPLPPPPPPPPPSFYNIFKKRNKNKRVHSIITGQPPPPPPPPPLPMSHIFNNMFKTGRKSKRIENPYSASVPPPPPPPPPRSIFNNMFKTGSKSKRYENKHYGSVPPPPPLPPPPRSIFNNMFKTVSKSEKFEKQHYISARPPPPPPLPPMSSVFNDLFKTQSNSRTPLPAKVKYIHEDKNSITGGETRMVNIPPPPPLPPFRMAESTFVARGDFVKIRSVHSSRCSSLDLEDVDLSYDMMDGGDGSRKYDLSSNKMDSGDGLGRSMTCPSPDVNLKADSFIARLKGEWKLEKMNSMKKKQLSPRNEINHKSY